MLIEMTSEPQYHVTLAAHPTHPEPILVLHEVFVTEPRKYHIHETKMSKSIPYGRETEALLVYWYYIALLNDMPSGHALVVKSNAMYLDPSVGVTDVKILIECVDGVSESRYP